MKQREPADVARLTCDGRWKRRHLVALREQFGDHALFDALFEPFDSTSRSDYSSRDQQIAGEFLLDLQPDCRLPVREAVERSLTRWNRSVEELPFYLCRAFGRDAVHNALDSNEHNSALNRGATEALATYRYWLAADDKVVFGEVPTKEK